MIAELRRRQLYLSLISQNVQRTKALLSAHPELANSVWKFSFVNRRPLLRLARRWHITWFDDIEGRPTVTALELATEKKNEECVELLLKFPNTGPCLDAALLRAVYHHYTPIVRLLLESGANPAGIRFRSSKLNALEVAASHGLIDIMQLFIDHGVDVISPFPGGSTTALNLAAYNDKPELVAFLLKNGASVNAVDEHGRTVYGETISTKLRSYACEKKWDETIRVLKAHGAQTSEADRRDIEEAEKENKQMQIAKYRREHGDLAVCKEFGHDWALITRDYQRAGVSYKWTIQQKCRRCGAITPEH